MSWSTEANVSCKNLFAMATYEHTNSMLSSTHLQLIGRGGKPGEPGRSNPNTLGPTTPEDSEAGVTSPGATLPGYTNAGATCHQVPK
jgi:hypothetical protein